MKNIQKKIVINTVAEKAFTRFVDELNEWWPKEYTWSQDTLKEIRIDGQKNGLCTEIGPHGFRCDWGRITEFKENETVELKWQISPKREPVPNSENASDVKIVFNQLENTSTEVTLEHQNFDKHGEGANEYMGMMDSPHGWEYILNCYKKYCED